MPKQNNWKFFPLYSLKVTDDDGLADPIFTGATIVSPEFMDTYTVKASGQAEGHKYFTGKPFASIFPEDSPAFLAAPKAYLFEHAPHSWIAVSREDQDQAEDCAARILAFLTASMVLRGNVVASFASTARALAWSTATEKVYSRPDGRLECTTKILANNHVLMNPLVVSKAVLRDSYRTGTEMTFQINAKHSVRTWDIYKDRPLANICFYPKGETANLTTALVHLVRACCAQDVLVQIQMAVTALELIVGTQVFADLKHTAHAFLHTSKDRGKLTDILTARHEWVHQGKRVSYDKAVHTAKEGIHVAYIMLDLFAGFSAVKPSKWKERVGLYVEAQKLADKLEKIDSHIAAESIRKAVTFDSPPTLSGKIKTAQPLQDGTTPPAQLPSEGGTTPPDVSVRPTAS